MKNQQLENKNYEKGEEKEFTVTWVGKPSGKSLNASTPIKEKFWAIDWSVQCPWRQNVITELLINIGKLVSDPW